MIPTASWRHVGESLVPPTEGLRMPDSPEYRLSQLEQLTSALKQRTEDHEGDIRSLGPLVVAHARLEEKLSGLQEATTALRRELAHAVEHFDTELAAVRGVFQAHREDIQKVREQREEREREREAKDRRYRAATWIAAIGMILTFVSTTVGVLTLVIH